MLTLPIVKAAKPKNKLYKLHDSGGLFLAVTPTGAKYWRFKYRFNGKEKLLSLKPYPEMSIKEARAARDKCRAQIAEGIDPGLEKRAKKKTGITFSAVAYEWHTTQLESGKWEPGTAANVWRLLDANILPFIADLLVISVREHHLIAAIKKMEARGCRYNNKRVMQYVNKVFKFANARGYMRVGDITMANPAIDIGQTLLGKKVEHFASIPPEQMPQLINDIALNKVRLYPVTQAALWLIMLTFVRTKELIEATWSEFDGDTWIVSSHRMKKRKVHLVPLSTQAQAVINGLKQYQFNDYLLPSPFKPKQHLSNNAILNALENLGYKGAMTGHGFRSLAMTTIQEQIGYPHHIVDRQLAHLPKTQLGDTYDRTQYLAERRKMMQEWGDYIERLSPVAFD